MDGRVPLVYSKETGHPMIIYSKWGDCQFRDPKMKANRNLFFFTNDNDPKAWNDVRVKANWNHKNTKFFDWFV